MYKSIIVIAGMPRSGTSWLGQIFDSSPNLAYRVQPLFSYAFKNAVDENSDKKAYVRFFNAVYHSNDEFLLQKEKRESGIYPTFLKKEKPDFLAFKTTRFHDLTENMLKLFENLKTICIVRHPCGAIYSWLNTPSEFPSTADPMKDWRNGKCRKTAKEEYWGFEDWKKVTTMHMKLESQYPKQFKIIKYQDLVDNTIIKTKDLFEFVGLELEDQTRRFIEECHSRHDKNSYSVYKKKEVAHRWKEGFPPAIQKEIIDEIKGTPLEMFMR